MKCKQPSNIAHLEAFRVLTIKAQLAFHRAARKEHAPLVAGHSALQVTLLSEQPAVHLEDELLNGGWIRQNPGALLGLRRYAA